MREDAQMERVSKVATALGHPVRAEVVRRLRDGGEMCVADAGRGLGGRISVWNHISTLRRHGIVTSRKDPARSPWRVYLTLNHAALEPLLALARPPA